MSNSERTTYFGPWVSFSTTKSNTNPIHVEFPSSATVTLAGQSTFSSGAVATFASGALIDLEDVDPIKFSNITTDSESSTFIADGHLSIVSHSANSMVIAIRSGATTYVWTNDAGAVV